MELIYSRPASGLIAVALTVLVICRCNEPTKVDYPAQSGIVFMSRIGGDAENFEIMSMRVDGSHRINLSNNPAGDFAPRVSPDGTLIAFVTNRDGNDEIYVMDIDGSNQINLTNNEAGDSEPSWSPDGSQIAFISVRDGEYGVFIMDSTGANQRRLTDDYYFKSSPDFSPDGSMIVFALEEYMRSVVCVMEADGTNKRRILETPFSYIHRTRWSPDGNKIVFEAMDSFADVYTINADGSALTNITNSAAADWCPSWSPNGSFIVFCRTSFNSNGIYFITPDASDLWKIEGTTQRDKCPCWFSYPEG